jgi:hypothetical protein
MMDSTKDMVVLNSFFDALDAGKACRHLEENEIPFVLENLSVRQQGVSRFQEGPAIRLDVLVHEQDLQQAKTCLRETMHLFPEREADIEEYAVDENETVVQVAACEDLTDVAAVRAVLKDAAIWCTVRSIVDEEDATAIIYSVEVKWQDIEQAMFAMERSSEAD